MTAFIITGMHRSGTSLLASLLQHGGVEIGTQLLAPAFDNPRGYFEDEAFMRLHEDMLYARGKTVLVERSFAPTVDSTETARAQQLIAARAHLPLWGWKDPRTSLFLDFWHALLPEARYLFVYRSPLEVLISLIRRRQPYMSGLTEGLEAWYSYNLRILHFAQAHPDRCVMCHIDGALGAIDTLVELCASRLGVRLALSQAEADAVYQADELQHLYPSAETIAELGAVHADAVRLYSALQQNAALAGPLEPRWDVPSTPTLHPAVARARLLALCATIAPDVTEAFFAHGDQDIPTLQHHVHAAYAHAARMEHEARQAQRGSAPSDAFALPQVESQMQFFKRSFQEAEIYARSLETAFAEAESYARSLETELRRRDQQNG